MNRPKYLLFVFLAIAVVWISNLFKTTKNFKMALSDHPYSKELKIASLAVKRASLLTKGLSDSIVETSKTGTQIKNDKSPVTVGDYASQALINNAIRLNFPGDKIVGEEDSLSLNDGSEEAKKLSDRILELLRETQKKTLASSEYLGELKTLSEVYESIDLGNYEGGNKGRFWALDPIDGTKGFLRGDQFAVCLALVEDGKVVLGVIGCPNLPEHITLNEEQSGNKGGLFSAIKGVGAFYTPLFTTNEFTPLKDQQQIHMTGETSPGTLKVVEGVEKGHSSHSTQSQIKQQLGFDESTVAKQTINLDSQVKYCVLAKGQADIYLRLPVSDTYREKIWDHAAGNVLVTESGGQVGDITGQELDFGKGRTLDSKGVIAANKAIFPKVIDAVKNVLSQ